MTNEERDVITRFIERVGGAGAAASGSVPASQASQALPPVDHDADALIGELLGKYPEARYRITQLAFVQEQALNAAQQRIQALQAQVQQAQSQQQGPSPWGAGAQPQPQQPRGFFSSLFGGGSSAPAGAPPPAPYQAPPQYAPQYAPPQAMFQPQGSGFLGGALRTAAGVAGGLVAGEALMNLFEGHHGFGGGGFEGPTSMPGSFVPGAPGDSAWLGGAAQPAGITPDPYDQGGAMKDDAGSDKFASNQPAADTSGWSPAPDQSSAWQPAADPSGGGWQDAPTDTGGSDGGWDSGSSDSGWTDSSSDA